MEDLTVVIPTYNSSDLLKKTIASLEKQRPHPSAFKVIIVDDGSSDGTAQYIGEYSGPLQLEGVILSSNQGRASARNIGARKAAAGLLLFLDGDMSFEPDFIVGHLKHHTDERTVVVGRVVYEPSLQNQGYARYLERRGAFRFKAGEQISGRYFLSGNSSLSRELFNATGGFDERLQYGEDMDLGMRLETQGARMIYDPMLTVTHLHLRSLDESLKMYYLFGKRTLPLLVEKYPHLYNALRLHWADGRGMRGIVLRHLLNEKLSLLVKSAVTRFENRDIPPFLYRYLIFRSYITGYRQSPQVRS